MGELEKLRGGRANTYLVYLYEGHVYEHAGVGWGGAGRRGREMCVCVRIWCVNAVWIILKWLR